MSNRIVVKSKANILIYYIAKINTTNKVTKNGYIVSSTIGYDFYQRVRFCRVSYGPLPFTISLSNDALFP